MPLRAFFVFPQRSGGSFEQKVERFNALTGILCFSTKNEKEMALPGGCCLNALTGILCFSTR